MKLVVGLGNPGPKYETTRHNVGFLAADRLIERWKARGPQTRNSGETYEAEVAGEKVLIVKPQTYMNKSGQCVGPIVQFFKLKPSDVVVLYDELDLKPLTMRIKTGGGAGGHNGIKSLDEGLGLANNGYHRIRIGIGHPRALNLKIQPVDYVLQQFSDQELEWLDPLLDRVAEATERVLSGDVKGAMTEFNRAEPGADQQS
jgi:peptidyl-tRNA hydrolase, PTH1 family